MRRPHRFQLAIVLLGVCLCMAHSTTAQEPEATGKETVAVGQPAPDFTLPMQEGMFTLSDQQGEYVVVVFARAHW